MTTPMISLREVVFRRGDFQLGPATVEIEPGYVVAVVGPNGSGKSTMFHMLMDLLAPDTGELRVLGQSYPEADIAARQRIGYVPERSVGMDHMTGREIGTFSSRWYPDWDMTRFQAFLKEMEIDPRQRFDALSKGLRRRLVSAIALSTGGDLLLADEPMDAIDPFFSERLLGWYTDFMAEGERSIVFSTHSLDDVRRVADYILLMKDGQFIGYYEKDTLLTTWQVLWVDSPVIPGTPGVVSTGDGSMQRVLTQDAEATRASLRVQGRSIVRTGAPELGEILGTLLDAGPTHGVAAMR